MKEAHNYVVDIMEALNGLIHASGVPADICLVKHEESGNTTALASKLKSDIRKAELPYAESWCNRIDEISALPSGKTNKVKDRISKVVDAYLKCDFFDCTNLDDLDSAIDELKKLLSVD